MAHDERLNRFLAYLDACGGEDRHSFVDEQGQPDVDAARRFAEALRSRFPGALEECLHIEQQVNTVRVSLVVHAHC